MEILAKLKPVLALNTVIDEERRLGFVSYGEIEASHLKAVEFMSKYAAVTFGEKFKTVVTTSAGFPLDQTYYQTVKGMVGAMEILAPGGKMFIASSCAEGMGSAEYVEAQRKLIDLGLTGFLDHILPKKAAAIDEWQTEMQLKPMRIGDIVLYNRRPERGGQSPDRSQNDRRPDGLGQSLGEGMRRYKNRRRPGRTLRGTRFAAE